MKLSLHPQAETEVEAVAAFYEKEATPALAAKFIKEFKRIAQLLVDNPAIGSPRSRGRRGFAMSLFPYTAIYRQLPDGIRILVVNTTDGTPAMAALDVSSMQLQRQHG